MNNPRDFLNSEVEPIIGDEDVTPPFSSNDRSKSFVKIDQSGMI